jgi:molecular chaperone GrpE
MSNKKDQTTAKKATETAVTDAAANAENAENTALKEQLSRALADYQNLVRRQKETQADIVTYARIEIFESLLQPLEHLSLAAKSLNDQGLNLVVNQFWQTLSAQGLNEFRPDGEKFDAQTMEVIEKNGDGDTVSATLSPGYRLNGQVIKVAKVRVG